MTSARRAIVLIIDLLAILVCLSMFILSSHAEDRADIAVLKSRADSIERHIDNTDKNVADQQKEINDLVSDMSAIKSAEKTAWALLGLLGTGGLVIRMKKGTQ